MEKKDSQNIQHISDTLDEVLVVLKTPENKVLQIIYIAAAVVGVFAIIDFFEKIFNWVFGG